MVQANTYQILIDAIAAKLRKITKSVAMNLATDIKTLINDTLGLKPMASGKAYTL
jgi:hypothetical protein